MGFCPSRKPLLSRKPILIFFFPSMFFCLSSLQCMKSPPRLPLPTPSLSLRPTTCAASPLFPLFFFLFRAVYEVSSDASLADAIALLEAHNLRCLPVRNARDPHSPDWDRRYLGVIDHSGIMLWVFSEASIPQLCSSGIPELCTAVVWQSCSTGVSQSSVPQWYARVV